MKMLGAQARTRRSASLRCGPVRSGVRALAVIAAVPLVLHVAGLAPAQAAPACPAASPDAASATAVARSCGHAVEDISQRSGTAQVFANPDGTWTATLSAEPVRVRRADGSWAPVDLTLVRTDGGSVRPVASPVPVALSGGGSGALVTLPVADGSVALGWPGSLPAPALSGPRATYPDVLPGVDLVLTDTVTGVNEVLVVKSRQAAANPALATLRFTTTLRGVTLSAQGSSVAALDATGSPVAVIGAPMMWDSTAAPVSSAPGQQAVEDGADSEVSGPGASARRAQMGMRLSDGQLVVSPAVAMLTAPDTRFPVYLDPDLTKNLWSWTMVNSHFPDQEYWDFDRDEHAKVGWTNKDKNGNAIPAMIYRSLFQFGTDIIHGKHILDADFFANLLHSASCSNSTTQLRRNTQMLGIGTTWNSVASSWGSPLAYVSDSNCNDVGGVVAHFSGQGITNVAVSAAASTSNYVTFGLMASDESDMSGWKKFDQAAKLTVTYNSYPNTPDTLTIDNKPCGTEPAYVSTVGGHNPVLRARLSDLDSQDHLTGNFSWTTSTGTKTGSQANIAPGATAQVTTSGADFTPGTPYSFTVSAFDGTDSSRTPAGPCGFVADDTPPDKRPLVTSADGRYPSLALVWPDGVGPTGQFTFSPNGVSDHGVDDVVAYLYGLAPDSPVTSVPAASLGGSASVLLTPTRAGLNDLFVRSVDRAGNLGPIADYRFFVGSGAAPVGLWEMDEGTGTTAADAGTGGHPLALTGTSWTSGRVIGTSALSLSGAGSSGVTSSPVLTTTDSYTVAAWVRPTNTSSTGTVVAQQGTHVSGAVLQHPAGGGWAFAVPGADAANPATVRATSSQPAQAGLWTHVAGVYDAGANQIKLYVNGALAASATVTVSWNATGPLSVGREWLNDAYTNYFAGDVAYVRVWDRVVGADELAGLAAATPAAQWELDDAGGTTAHDDNGLHDLTLDSGASWVSPGHNYMTTDDRGALALDGTSTAHADSTGPVVETNQSFSVTAWVKLNVTGTANQLVVSQAGTHVHAFRLGYNGASGNWIFRTVGNDIVNAPGSNISSGATLAVAGQWTFLAGVWDGTSRTLSLYVNGVLVSQSVTAAPFAADGVLTIGRDWINDAYADYLNGQVDDVRLYAGALPAVAIGQLYSE